jgi:glycosyltransferase involved in cell wall biosynthesis
MEDNRAGKEESVFKIYKIGKRYVMNTVSIIIPIYNAQMYIEACLDSILKQTFQEFEVILVDDGSSDASGSICDYYAQKNKRITVFHRENAGVSASRNFGLAHSTGNYILFVDADDTIESDMLEGCIRLAEKNDAELVICSFRYYMTDENRMVENRLGNEVQVTEKELFDLWFTQLVDKEILNPPWNKLIRRDLLDKNFIQFHEKFSICEDMAFSIQILGAAKKIVLTDKMYYNYYLKSSGTLVFKFHDNYFEALTNFYQYAYGYCTKFKNNSKQIKVVNTLYVNLIIMYINQICTKSHWDKITRHANIKKIRNNENYIFARKNVSLNSKKKLVCFLLLARQYSFIDLLYQVKNSKSRKAIKRKLCLYLKI